MESRALLLAREAFGEARAFPFFVEVEQERKGEGGVQAASVSLSKINGFQSPYSARPSIKFGYETIYGHFFSKTYESFLKTVSSKF